MLLVWLLGFVETDDLMKAHPERIPARPKIGIAPKITEAELIMLAVMQALLGHTSGVGCGMCARTWLARSLSLPGQSGCNKRLRKLSGTMSWLITMLAAGPAQSSSNPCAK